MNLKATLALAASILGLASCTTTGSTASEETAPTSPPRGYSAPASPFANAAGH